MDDVKLLLDKVESIDWKYREVLRDSQYTFNVFTLLRDEGDEVYLHSRFLSELMDPQGTHAQGDVFLDLFLTQVDITSFDLQDARVQREHQNIDIFIANQNQAIIIENKIHATDQDRQLERYYQATKREGFKDIFIVYLTLDGNDPSTQSVGDLEETEKALIRAISYKQDIHEWLEECIKSAARHSVIRETLVQYQRLVERLTGQSFAKGYLMEIRDMLIDERNIELAIHISEALPKAKIEIQFRFWKELEKQIRERGFDIADYQKYSKKRVRDFYKVRDRDRYYGIMFKLRRLENVDLLFYIAVGRSIYYGFVVVRDGERMIAQEPQFDHLVEIVKELDETFKRSEGWIGWKFTRPKLNFWEFNDPNIFALADPSKRAKRVSNLLDEIQEHITRFNEFS